MKPQALGRLKAGAMSPLVQGRGLKPSVNHLPETKVSSPLVQGRGLKHRAFVDAAVQLGSPLVQGRGLKHRVLNEPFRRLPVAPRAGAWIETVTVVYDEPLAASRPSCRGVD